MFIADEKFDFFILRIEFRWIQLVVCASRSSRGCSIVSCTTFWSSQQFLSAKIWYWLKQMKIFKIGDAESPWHLYFLFCILRSRDSSMQQQRDLPIQRNNEDLHTNFRWSRILYSGNAWTRYFVKSFRIYLIKTTSLWRAPFNQNTTADKKLLRALNLNFVCRCGCVCRCSTHRVAHT